MTERTEWGVRYGPDDVEAFESEEYARRELYMLREVDGPPPEPYEHARLVSRTVVVGAWTDAP